MANPRINPYKDLRPCDLEVDDARVLVLLETLGYIVKYEHQPNETCYYFTEKGSEYFKPIQASNVVPFPSDEHR